MIGNVMFKWGVASPQAPLKTSGEIKEVKEIKGFSNYSIKLF
jgi:hypothetical protein